jgi:hypothetical protein
MLVEIVWKSCPQCRDLEEHTAMAAAAAAVANAYDIATLCP